MLVWAGLGARNLEAISFSLPPHVVGPPVPSILLKNGSWICISLCSLLPLCSHYLSPCLSYSTHHRWRFMLWPFPAMFWTPQGRDWAILILCSGVWLSAWHREGARVWELNEAFLAVENDHALLWSHQLKGPLTCSILLAWQGIVLWPVGEQGSLLQIAGRKMWIIGAFHRSFSER